MKKWLCIGLSCLLTLCLTACGGASDDAAPTESPDLLEMSRGVRSLFADDGESADADGGESIEARDGNETPVPVTDAPEAVETAAPEVTDAPEAVETAASAITRGFCRPGIPIGSATLTR